ncbi:RadC family protein [Kordiimonas pumila]|uniref:DNA repair protein RadC n=1 Tax=Kordiimonas pumila TaxID=2161677 RepID=A0ABV7D9K0_9PROT|nr:DNA repair protein RadC [Kordiimonas pumila]
MAIGKTPVEDKPDHRHGHRQRLRERFLKAGPDGLADYELLELILFLAIPRRDVKPLAKELISHFGSYAGVLSAETAMLTAYPGLGETAVAAIKSVQASALHLAKAEMASRPVLSNWQAVIGYLQGAMAHLPREQFRVLLLDKKNALLSDELLSDGTVDETAVYPREIVRRALSANASALILVHNHPSGDPAPSRADIVMTKEVLQTCKTVGIHVHDHIIIGKYGQTSFREQGLI